MNVIEGILSSIKDLSKRVGRLETQEHRHPHEALITAATITLDAGTSGNAVADLRTAHDALYYTITEAAATPGIRLTVHFTSVKNFTRVKIIGYYKGSSTHSVGIQLYNWATAHWDTYNAMQTAVGDIATHDEIILDNLSFQVSSCTSYVGTGANLGKVDVRFNHTMSGSANHSLSLDVVALVK
jgi:hypothetical protein